MILAHADAAKAVESSAVAYAAAVSVGVPKPVHSAQLIDMPSASAANRAREDHWTFNAALSRSELASLALRRIMRQATSREAHA